MSNLLGRKSTRCLTLCVLAVLAAALTACDMIPGVDAARGLLDGVDLPGGDGPAGGVDESGRTFTFTGLSLDTLDSYTASYTLDFQGAQAGGIGVDIDSTGQIQRQRDPKTLVVQSELSGDGLMAGMSLLGQIANNTTIDAELMTTADRVYLTGAAAGQPTTCRSFPAIGVDAGSVVGRLGWGAVQVEELLNLRGDQQPVELTLVGQETVNGVLADHYSAVDVALGSLTSGAVDLWYVPGDAYITRLTLNGQGSIPLYGSGAIDLAYDVTSINQPVSATAPADCTELSLEDLPLDQLNLEGLNLEDLGLPAVLGE